MIAIWPVCAATLSQANVDSRAQTAHAIEAAEDQVEEWVGSREWSVANTKGLHALPARGGVEQQAEQSVVNE